MSADLDPLYPLIQSAARGERDGFQHLYEQTAAKLFGVLLRILKEKPLAEEICQDVFVTIWEKAALYNPAQGRVMSWMIAIARNRAIDTLRRGEAKLRQNTMSDPALLETEAFENPDPLAPDIALQLTLSQCLREIEEKSRQSVLLAYYHGFSRQELADTFDVPTNTMKSWLRRALADLKTCLERAS